jgi:hypothetical protein
MDTFKLVVKEVLKQYSSVQATFHTDGRIVFSQDTPQEIIDGVESLVASLDVNKLVEREEIDNQIMMKEREITERRKRDAILTEQGKLWLAAKEEEIDELRIQRKALNI